MEDLLQKYKEKAPEVVFEWHDEETGAEGWIVILLEKIFHICSNV